MHHITFVGETDNGDPVVTEWETDDRREYVVKQCENELLAWPKWHKANTIFIVFDRELTK